MLATLDLLEGPSPSARATADFRRRLDLAIGRALVEPTYAALLMADPTVALGDAGCTPQQRLQLRGIRAHSIKDFACQAQSLFWLPRPPRPFAGNCAGLPLAAGM
jgi:hypothetical protein